MTAQFERQPGNVFVFVNPPTAAHVANASRAYQDWKTVASQIIADVQRQTTPPVEKADQHTRTAETEPCIPIARSETLSCTPPRV